MQFCRISTKEAPRLAWALCRTCGRCFCSVSALRAATTLRARAAAAALVVGAVAYTLALTTSLLRNLEPRPAALAAEWIADNVPPMAEQVTA